MLNRELQDSILKRFILENHLICFLLDNVSCQTSNPKPCLQNWQVTCQIPFGFNSLIVPIACFDVMPATRKPSSRNRESFPIIKWHLSFSHFLSRFLCEGVGLQSSLMMSAQSTKMQQV